MDSVKAPLSPLEKTASRLHGDATSGWGDGPTVAEQLTDPILRESVSEALRPFEQMIRDVAPILGKQAENSRIVFAQIDFSRINKNMDAIRAIGAALSGRGKIADMLSTMARDMEKVSVWLEATANRTTPGEVVTARQTAMRNRVARQHLRIIRRRYWERLRAFLSGGSAPFRPSYNLAMRSRGNFLDAVRSFFGTKRPDETRAKPRSVSPSDGFAIPGRATFRRTDAWTLGDGVAAM